MNNKMNFFLITLGIAILICVMTLFPEGRMLLLMTGFIVSYAIYKHLNDKSENSGLIVYNAVYEQLQDSVLDALKEVYRIAGNSSNAPKNISVSPDQRYRAVNGNLFYKYGFMIPDDFSISNDDLQKFMNEMFINNGVMDGCIPAICKVIRKGNRIELIATTCIDKGSFYNLIRYFKDMQRKPAVSRKDDDF